MLRLPSGIWGVLRKHIAWDNAHKLIMEQLHQVLEKARGRDLGIMWCPFCNTKWRTKQQELRTNVNPSLHLHVIICDRGERSELIIPGVSRLSGPPPAFLNKQVLWAHSPIHSGYNSRVWPGKLEYLLSSPLQKLFAKRWYISWC